MLPAGWQIFKILDRKKAKIILIGCTLNPDNRGLPTVDEQFKIRKHIRKPRARISRCYKQEVHPKTSENRTILYKIVSLFK